MMSFASWLRRFRKLTNIRRIFYTTILLISLTYLLKIQLGKSETSVRFIITRGDSEPSNEHFPRASNADLITYKSTFKESLTATQPTKINFCPISWSGLKSRVEGSKKPLINLNRNKFLLPVLINGPNNQLVGLRKSMYVAIRLNRTIVIPLLFKHKLNDGQGRFIDPTHRLDFDVLENFIPTVTLKQFAERCHGNIEAVLRVRVMTPGVYRKLERYYSMKFAGPNGNPVIELPKDFNPKEGKNFAVFNSSKDTIESLYGTETACAIHPYHFSNLKIHEKPPSGEFPTYIGDLSDKELYSEIIRFTPPPRHVVEMARNFISDVIRGNPYISVHWRFDKTDWMRRCLSETPWGTQGRRKMCETILKLTPEEISHAIANKAETSDVNIQYVYMAAPPGGGSMVDNVTRALKEKHEIRVFSSSDLRKHWKSTYSGCDWLWKDENDILSTTEMEICRQADVFLRSGSSTWSKNVQLGRNPERFPFSTNDKGILQLVKEVYFSGH